MESVLGKGHNHAIPGQHKERPLIIALLLTSAFLIVEVVGGFLTGSLALISDAAHMLTDTAALAIALAAIRIGRRPTDALRTFGYYRFEILAAAFNAVMLFLVAMYILYEAYARLKNPPEIQSLGMLVIASIGLIVNLISMSLLAGDKDKSLNVKGAYLEVWSDMLGSIGVILGAIIIYFTQWVWVDSLIAVGIGLWVLPRTWILLKESINILLEGVPEGIDMLQLEQVLREVEGVVDIHELHVWAITSGKVSLTAHVVIAAGYDCDAVTTSLKELLKQKFNITHTTLEHERKKCAEDFTH
ncbi:MAG: cation transporter [Gammaproteobacteria bacterium]|nr:cation transporter [Gammaproteobacteria bacterium]